MKLIIVNCSTLRKRIIKATPDMTVADVLRIMKEDERVLTYRNLELRSEDTLHDSGLRTRHKLFLDLPRKRVPKTSVKRADAPCMITLDDADERAEMSCGHAITPRSLFKLCEAAFKEGKTEMRCPYVGDDMSGCKKVWSMEELIEKACLNQREHGHFMMFISETISNLSKVKENISLDEELTNILNECEWKELGRQIKCPSRRACPKCGAVIEHVSGCNRMRCAMPGCSTHFCFICLNIQCHGNCYVAPIQFQSKRITETDSTEDDNEDNETVAENQLKFVRHLSKRLSQISELTDISA